MSEGTVYNILNGIDNNFTSIQADTNASLTNGRVYLANNEAVHILDNSTRSTYDYYSRTDHGRDNNVLLNPDVVEFNIIDIDVGYGNL